MKNELFLIVLLLIFINLRFAGFIKHRIQHVFDVLFISLVLFLSFKIYGFSTISYVIFVAALVISFINIMQANEETAFTYLLIFLALLGLFLLLGFLQIATFFGALFYLLLMLIFIKGLFYEIH